MKNDFDVLIIGGGSAGSAAACRAAEEGLSVCVVEKMPGMGGTATFGGINRYEQCAGSHGIHESLAQELYAERNGGTTCNLPNSVIAGSFFDGHSIPPDASPEPFSECPWAFDSIGEQGYGMFMSRKRVRDVIWSPFAYSPEAMEAAIRKRLRNAVLLLNTAFIGCEVCGDRIESVTVRSCQTNEELKLTAKVYIDCSGDIVFARAAGCEHTLGSEPESQYGESLAPDEYERTTNGNTLVFAVESTRDRYIDKIPDGLHDEGKRWLDRTLSGSGVGVVSCFTHNPYTGEINVNMLPTIQGAEYFSYPADEAYRVCLSIVWAYWHFLQTEKRLDHMRMKRIFPMVGVRESYRLAGQLVLTQNDCLAGIFNQRHADESVAYGAHSLDTHGKRSSKLRPEDMERMPVPYGVPYRCLVTKEYSNMLVACRGSSFSHLAASATRLIVTMMQLGEAAACAALDIIRRNADVNDADISFIRDKLRAGEYEERCAQNLL